MPVSEGSAEGGDVQTDKLRKADEFESWASEAGIPTADYVLVEKKESIKPWETQELGILVDVKQYSRVREWLEKSPETRVDYSWAGRMAAYDVTPDGHYRRGSAFRDFAFFERNERGERVVRTHHTAFKKFAAERGVAIPSGHEVQGRLDRAGVGAYERALEQIHTLFPEADPQEERRLGELKGKVESALLYRRLGAEEPPETVNIDRGETMSDRETNYNDLVYNADDFLSTTDYEELGIPERGRLSTVDGETIERLCREFGDELRARGIYH